MIPEYLLYNCAKEVQEMEETMTMQEQIIQEINVFSMLWRIQSAMPENVENRELTHELKLSEIRLHALGVNTDELKLT